MVYGTGEQEAGSRKQEVEGSILDVAADKRVKACFPWGAAVEGGRPLCWLAVRAEGRGPRVSDPASDLGCRNTKIPTRVWLPRNVCLFT